MTTLTWIILGIIIVVILAIIGMYNSLIRSKNRTEEAWSDIEVQLKRRYDLIPNLVETVKGYARHEKELLEKVTQARSEALSAQGPQKRAMAENQLSATLKSLFAVSENYPDLKASQNFLQLQDELSDTENKIQAARRFYNSNVRDYNIKMESFPTNLMAQMMSFNKKEFFEVESGEEKEPVKVRF